MKSFVLKIFVVAFLCVVCIGCGNGLVKVSGKITYNNAPVKDGQIRFLPVSGKGPSAAAIIINGQYSVEVMPGEKKVEVLGYKIIGQKNIGKVIDIKSQILPPKFNEKTELTCEIVAGNDTQNFELSGS